MFGSYISIQSSKEKDLSKKDGKAGLPFLGFWI